MDAVGHRVVHGGSAFKQPILLEPDTDAALEALADLAPLHNPPSLAAIEAMRSVRPDLPQVACFDTTFHADMPQKAATYAVPIEWRTRWDIRRFGFHGLSHSWASRRAGELLGQSREHLRLVTAHLGAGASLAAVCFGRSVDTTMGFTPMEGLVMATRSGSVDPGLLLWVQRRGGFSVDDIEEALDRQSGLRGLSGESGDLRRVFTAADAGDKRAQARPGGLRLSDPDQRCRNGRRHGRDRRIGVYWWGGGGIAPPASRCMWSPRLPRYRTRVDDQRVVHRR